VSISIRMQLARTQAVRRILESPDVRLQAGTGLMHAKLQGVLHTWTQYIGTHHLFPTQSYAHAKKRGRSFGGSV
jgi:hypothetical protein